MKTISGGFYENGSGRKCCKESIFFQGRSSWTFFYFVKVKC